MHQLLVLITMCLWEQACWPSTHPMFISSCPCVRYDCLHLSPSPFGDMIWWWESCHMAEVCLRTPACKLKEWSCSFKQQGVLWNQNYTVFLIFAPVRSCCEWPSEITRNKGNHRRERCTSFLSSRGNQDFYGTDVYKNNHVDFTPPSRSYSAHLGSTVSCLRPCRSRASPRPVICLSSSAEVLHGY